MVKGGPSLNPSGKAPEPRLDMWQNTATGHGTARDRRLLTTYGVNVVTDLEARQLWRSEWLCKRIIEVLPGEANRRGWTLKLDDQKRAEHIMDRSETLDVDGHMCRAAEYERAYGGAAILPAIEGAQGDLDTPLDLTRIAKVTALHVLEPQELYPIAWYTDMNSPKWRHPAVYRVMPLTGGRSQAMAFQAIHESRLIIFPGKRVSAQTQPGQREGWGDSELNHSKEMIADAGLTWGSVATLLHEFGHGVYEIDGLAKILSHADGIAQIERRLAAMDMFKSTMRASAIDAKDRYSRQATPASGLDGLLSQQKEWIAAVADMPMPVLYGQQLGGLQSTGDAEIRTWYAKVEKKDATHYNPRREAIVRLLLLEDGGKEPNVWSCEPKPLWSPSEKEQAETRKLDAETDQIYVDMGAPPETFLRARMGEGAQIQIDWAEFEKQKKEAEAMAKEQAQIAAEAAARPKIEEPSDKEQADQ